MKKVLVIIPMLLLLVQCAFAQINTYPWSEDFESNSFETNGWTTSIVTGSAEWRLGTGSANGGGLAVAHSGSANALISNTARLGDTAVLLTPVFVRPSDIDTLELSFYYANPAWGGDHDHMIVKLVDDTNETVLAEIQEYHDGWLRMRIQFVVSDLPENFQIAFVGIPKYGYGFLLDDVFLKEYEAPVLDVVDTDTYRQVGTGTQTVALPVKTSTEYGYTQQIFMSDEMGGQKTIYSLSFNYSGNETEEVQRLVKIYMANTEKALFSNYYDFAPVSDMIKVFSGVMTIPAGESWATVVLETPFVYDGTSNLVLAVWDNSGTTVGDRLFYCSEMENSLAITNFSDYNINISYSYMYGSLGYFRNNVRFGTVEQTPVLPAVDVEETSAYLQVGTNTTNNQNTLPVNTGENWSVSQQIFDSRELGAEKAIYSLSFNYTGNTNGEISRILKVYLAHTEKSEYDTYEEVVDWSNMTRVYSGQALFDSESGWVTLAFNEPFQYNGTDNLMVTVVDATGTSLGSQLSFACSSIEKSRAVVFSNYSPMTYDDLDYYGGTMLYNRNNIRFGLEYIEPVMYEVDTLQTEEYLQVGTGNVNNAENLPIQTNREFSYSQQIFRAEDFGGEHLFYSLSFNYFGNTNGELARNVKVYLGHTQKDEFDIAGGDMVSIDDMTKVYSGLMHFDSESGWAMVVFDRPFAYNGTDNLVVAVADITDRSDSQLSFVCSNVSGSQSVYVGSSYMVSLNTSSFTYYDCALRYYRNNVRFGTVYVEPPAHEVDTVETAEYLQIGTGSETTGYLPTNLYYNYSYSQQLFASYEMGGPRTIYTVSFNYTGNTNDVDVIRSTKLYMGHTDKYEFDYSCDWVDSGIANVCSENMIVDSESGWVTFVLRSPFQYNGTDNLVVALRDYTGRYLESHFSFVCSNAEYQSAMYYNDDEANLINLGQYNYNVSCLSKRNNIRFGLEYVEPPVYEVDTIETDSYLQVGTSSSIREALPVNTSGKYGYSQQLFNALEMGGARTIYSLSFNCVTNDNADAVRDIKIYMGNVNNFEFEYNDWVDVVGLEVDNAEYGFVSQVFSGEVTIPANSGWVTIILDQPFEYNGTDNLVVAWLDNTGVSHTEKHFVCTNSDLGNSIIAASNMGVFDLENADNIIGNVLQYRSNIRFGLEHSVVYTLDVTSNDDVMGRVSGSGRYEEGSLVSVSAAAYPCFRFSKWNDGVTENPRQVEMTSDISLVAMFETIDTDTLNYDNDDYNISLGYHQQNVEWGISFMPQHLALRPHLADVLFYVDGQYSYGEYRLAVYQGFDTLPVECILRDTLTVEMNTEGWLNFGFDTIDIDTTRALWVILSSEGGYPAAASTFVGAGYENGAWWNPNGTWTQQTYGAWMIKAVLPVEENGGSGEEGAVEIVSEEYIGIYPNPVNTYFSIEGVVEGETIEIYGIDGRIMANFKYAGDVVDVTNLPAGMYVLRCGVYKAKFIKE